MKQRLMGWRTKGRVGIITSVVVLAGGIGTGYFVNAAAAAPVPPAPTSLTGPTTPTASTSATFTFKDSQTTPAVTFKCSRDASAYATCVSGVTYSGLAQGTHTFSVEAVSGSSTSSPTPTTPYTWVIDTSAPSITLSFPANNGAYNATSWTGSVTGSATDPSGVKSVSVAVLQQSSGKYWNGSSSSFSSSSRVFNAAALTAGTTAPWSYALARPADGVYTLYVEATDSLGNTTSISNLTTAQFIIDTSLPAAPVIVGGGPTNDNPSSDTSPEFTLTDTSWPNVTFRCGVDLSAVPVNSSTSANNCTGDTDHDGDGNVEGEWQFENLAPGPHCFYVWAIDKAGNVGPSIQDCWTVIGPPTTIVVSSGSPQTTLVHSSFGAPLVAKVTDSHGDPVPGTPVTFSAPASGASGTFASCAGGNNGASTTCVVDTNASGIATSSTVTANTVAGGPYGVSASVNGVSTPANFSLTNTIAGASKLVFITQPSSGQNITAGNSTAFKVAVEDPYGNIETTDNATKVTLGFSANPGSSTLNCTNGGGSGPVTVSAGVAGFTCSLNKAGTGYKLSATSVPTRTAAPSNSFNVVAGSAMTLVFSAEPPTSTVASSTFSTTLSIEDLYGNVVTTDSNTVTLSLLANPCSGTLNGANSKAAVHGVVTFSGLQITKACSGYTLWAYDLGDGAIFTTSNPFAITPAGASKLVFTAEPPASTPSTSTFGVTVTIEDTYGNTVTTDTHTVALSLSTNPCAGTLSGTKSKAAVGGVATFSGLQITKACTGYKLSASDSSDSLSTTSTAFAITASANTITVISGNNQSATQGAAFAAPLVVEVTNGSNPVSGASVTFSAPALTSASGTFSNSTNTITATTGTNGQLSENFTANSSGGQYTVTATTPGATSPADFTLLNGENITVNGSITPKLYPGTGQPINLSITNPNPENITVALGSITLGVTTNKVGCVGSANFTLSQNLLVNVVVPPGTWSLSTLSPAIPSGDWPVLKMLDLQDSPPGSGNGNQDACENAALTLSWGGTASGS